MLTCRNLNHYLGENNYLESNLICSPNENIEKNLVENELIISNDFHLVHMEKINLDHPNYYAQREMDQSRVWMVCFLLDLKRLLVWITSHITRCWSTAVCIFIFKPLEEGSTNGVENKKFLKWFKKIIISLLTLKNTFCIL